MQRKVIWVVLLLVGSTTSYAQMDKYLKDSIPNAWVESELFDPTLPSEDRWWNTFNDSVLSRLIVEAVENNYDILMAADRMDQSRANMRMQQSGFYPKIGVEAAWMPQQSMQTGRTQHGSAQVDLSWEVDLIGSIRNRAKSQKEMFNVSQSEYNAVLVSLCAQVASTYINLRVAQNQLYVANINLKSQEDILKIAEARYSAGLVSALDVAQAKTVYESTKAIIPAWEAQSICYSNALSVLLGKYPWQMRKELQAYQRLPNPPSKIAVGIPAQIVRQRPDVTAAEKTILSKAAYVGATKADWWPKFYVHGSFGYNSENFKDFVNKDNMVWQIGPSIRWNIFTGLENNQATKLAKAQLDESINNYNQTILIALEDVDNAMNFYAKSIDQIKANASAVNQAKLTLTLSLDLYTQGLSGFQNVLDAQRSLLSYENAYVDVAGTSLQQLILLYKALGGGWQLENVPTTAKKK